VRAQVDLGLTIDRLIVSLALMMVIENLGRHTSELPACASPYLIPWQVSRAAARSSSNSC
jgi:hypothetical protein